MQHQKEVNASTTSGNILLYLKKLKFNNSCIRKHTVNAHNIIGQNIFTCLIYWLHVKTAQTLKQWKSTQRDTNTARPPQSPYRRTESAMAVVLPQSPHRRTESGAAVVRQSQNFPPSQTPFPGVQDRQNLISWRRPPAPTDPVWWRSMHSISSYSGNRHCPPARHKHTDRINVF